MWYDLDGTPIDALRASELLSDGAARRVARTIITTDRERIEVSTVFLVHDHNWFGGPPILWETMTFGGPADGEQRRYCSRDEAERGHAETVALCRSWCEIEGAAILAEETVPPDTVVP